MRSKAAIEVIKTRRSIRKFTSTPIADDLIRTILEAAIQAPSGKNRQPWRFIVFRLACEASLKTSSWMRMRAAEASVRHSRAPAWISPSKLAARK